MSTEKEENGKAQKRKHRSKWTHQHRCRGSIFSKEEVCSPAKKLVPLESVGSGPLTEAVRQTIGVDHQNTLVKDVFQESQIWERFKKELLCSRENCWEGTMRTAENGLYRTSWSTIWVPEIQGYRPWGSWSGNIEEVTWGVWTRQHLLSAAHVVGFMQSCVVIFTGTGRGSDSSSHRTWGRLPILGCITLTELKHGFVIFRQPGG